MVREATKKNILFVIFKKLSHLKSWYIIKKLQFMTIISPWQSRVWLGGVCNYFNVHIPNFTFYIHFTHSLVQYVNIPMSNNCFVHLSPSFETFYSMAWKVNVRKSRMNIANYMKVNAWYYNGLLKWKLNHYVLASIFLFDWGETVG